MINKLSILVNNTSSRVLGQKLKSKINRDLYNWVLAETCELSDNATITERVYYLLQNKPSLLCKNNCIKKFVPKTLSYGYCGSISHCKCFQESASHSFDSMDRTSALEKRKTTWLSTYGVDNPARSLQIQEKRKATILSKNSTTQYAELKSSLQSAGFNKVIDRVSTVVSPLFSQAEYNGCFRKNFYLWQCTQCQTEFTDHVDYGRTPKCPTCFPKEKSEPEREITQWITSFGINVINNNRTIVPGYELDLWIPSHNIAIEHNGVYWHSSKFKSSTYHVDKMLAAKNQGVHLIQIFEDEWSQKQDIVKSRLLSYLNLSTKYYARKLKIVEVSSTEYKKFVTLHHLQGYATASIKLGLVDTNNTLIAVMSFSASRYNDAQYELIRYCSVGNVIGGASKLFKSFITQYSPASIVSFANRNWSTGNLYRQLGFVDVTKNARNTSVFYYKRPKRYHRLSVSKKRLIELGYDPAKSAKQIREELGYLEIFDCGNLKFLWVGS